MSHRHNVRLSPPQNKPRPRHPYAFANFSKDDFDEYREKKIRRDFPLFIPDDGPNGLTLPGGIGPGDRLRIEVKKEKIRTVRGPKIEEKKKV